MFNLRMLARLALPALGAIAFQSLVAGEPAATPPAAAPPATSIREWMAPPNQTPAAGSAATPTSPAKSISEWRTTPAPTPGPCPVATPLANMAAAPAAPAANPQDKPAASAAVPTSPITISLTSTMRRGNLVVLLDGAPVFNESFEKPLLIISQTTTWDPLQVPAGTHRLTAKVYGTKKTYVSKTYDLHVSSVKGAGLRFVMQGDQLKVAVAS